LERWQGVKKQTPNMLTLHHGICALAIGLQSAVRLIPG